MPDQPPTTKPQAVEHKVDQDPARGQLFARKQAIAEWWYYNGHLRGGANRYTFHVAFFRYDSSGVRIGHVVPLKVLTPKVTFAHVSITDHQTGRTDFAHRRAFRKGNFASSTELNVAVHDWMIRGDSHEQQIKIDFADCRLNLDVRPVKPMVVYGDAGLFGGALPRVSSYCSFPRMKVSGQIHVNGQSEVVDGAAWMDREFGQVGPDAIVAGWDWIAIQLDDGYELMVYWLLRRDQPERCLRAALIDPVGGHRVLDGSQIQIQPLAHWQSTMTGANYVTCWSVCVPDEDIKLTVRSLFDDAEFDTRGSTSTFYRECPAEVSGTRANENISGRAFIESVGHDTKPVIGRYNSAKRNMSIAGYLRNEICCRLPGGQSSIIQHSTLD